MATSPSIITETYEEVEASLDSLRLESRGSRLSDATVYSKSSSIRQDSVVSLKKSNDSADDDDDEYDTDLEIADEKDEFDLTGTKVYLETCGELGVVPASYFIRHMRGDTLILRHHGLGPLGGKAIAIPLVTNTTVLHLDLEDNWLASEGAIYICDMLMENCYIHHLSLAENKIGSRGTAAICEMMCCNTTITTLNLSGNEFQDKDAPYFANAILENQTIRELNLSHNKFSEGSGEVLGHAVGENETLEILDLSWNSFRRKAGIDLLEGIKGNTRLKKVDLSYNGISNEGAAALAELLKNNTILLEFDISNNRITYEAIPTIAKGLEANETLKTLRIGQNPIAAAGAMMLLSAINNERSVMTLLDMASVLVEKEFAALESEMLQSREFKVIHGGILSNYVIKGKPAPPEEESQPPALEEEENSFIKKNPLAILKDYVEKKNLRLVDFFNQLDKDKDFRITSVEFKDGIKKLGIPISEEQTDTLIQQLDKGENKDGMVDYRPLLQ